MSWSGLCIFFAVFLALMMGYVTHRVSGLKNDVKALSASFSRLKHKGMVEVTRQMQYIALLEHDLAFERPLPPTRGFAASPDFLLEIYNGIQRKRPGLAVEFGSGMSTLVTARALQQIGRGIVYSFDHDAEWAQRTRDMLEQYGVSKFAKVVHAPLREIDVEGRKYLWYSTDSIPEQEVEFFVIDGPLDSLSDVARLPALHVLADRLAPSAVGYLDDAMRPGEKAAAGNWERVFPHIRQKWLFLEKGGLCLEMDE